MGYKTRCLSLFATSKVAWGGTGMDNIFELQPTGVFTLEKANTTIAVLNKFTKTHSQFMNEKMAQLQVLLPKDSERQKSLELEIDTHLEQWKIKVRKLGGKPKGLWLVDLDAGDGFYCWKFPETKVEHWHAYNKGYSERISLQKRDEMYKMDTPGDSSVGISEVQS